MSGQTPRARFEERAISALKSGQSRLTQPRRKIIELLAEADQALSAASIHDQLLERGESLDLASVYRTLNLLLEQNVVHHIAATDGYSACTVEDHCGASQHLVCSECGKVEELAFDAIAVDATTHLAQKSGFTLKSVRLEIEGTCSDCHNS